MKDIIWDRYYSERSFYNMNDTIIEAESGGNI